MISEGIQKILDIGQAPTIEIDGRTYWTNNHHEVGRPSPLIPIADVKTLSGFVSYLENCDRDPANCLIVVKSHYGVILTTKADNLYNERDVLIVAKYEFESFPFGRFIDIKDFIIKTQCLFSDSDEKKKLLNSVSLIRGEEVTDYGDDGITQSVAMTAKFGRISEKKEPLAAIVELAPKRTFADVEQPTSKFLFRLQQQRDARPLAALFEADGGQWQLDACNSIAKWLRENETVKKLGVPVIG